MGLRFQNNENYVSKCFRQLNVFPREINIPTDIGVAISCEGDLLKFSEAVIGCYTGYLSKAHIISNLNLTKSRLPITYFPAAQSFWNVARSTAVIQTAVLNTEHHNDWAIEPLWTKRFCVNCNEWRPYSPLNHGLHQVLVKRFTWRCGLNFCGRTFAMFIFALFGQDWKRNEHSIW